MRHALLAIALLAASCSAPTLQQRQADWHRYRDMTRATCMVGRVDPAMPDDVRTWCTKVTAP